MEHKSSNVAYLSYDGLTDPLGQSQIIPYVVGLSKNGYRFTIFSFEKKDRFQNLYVEIKNQLDQNGIEWKYLMYTKWPPVVSTLWDVLKLWQAFVNCNRKRSFRIVHCRSYITSLVGLKAKNKFHIKFIFDMRGFWADERVEGGLWNLKNPFYRLIYQYFKKKERRFLSEADYVISLTEIAKQEVHTWDIKLAPLLVIPTCVDLSLFNSKKVNEEQKKLLRMKLDISNDAFVLLYLGSWGTWYLTNDMINFFKVIKERRRDSIFLILTSNEVEIPTSIKSFVRVTHASHENVPLYISISNGSVVFIKPSFSKKASSATKLAELIAMNVPVVTNHGWGDTELIKAVGVKIIPNTLPQALHEGIDYLLTGPEIRNINLHRLSLQTGINDYSRVYQALLSK